MDHFVSMESPLNKDGTREAGETIRGCDKAIRARAITKGERFKMLEEGAIRKRAQTTTTSKIQKVVFLLREHKQFEKYFEPRVVSLGPIHHGTEKLQLTEKYKHILAFEFIEESGHDQETLYNMVGEKIYQLRECFDEEVIKNYDMEDLAWILFVDGCALVQFIYCSVNNKFKQMGIKPDSVVFWQQDLFLLENQLPFCLLVWLISFSQKKTELKRSIEIFIDAVVQVYQQKKQKSTNMIAKEGESIHQLHQEPIHLLDLLRTRLLGLNMVCHVSAIEINQHDCQLFRNVQELKAAGIRFQLSETSFLTDISFTRFVNFYPGYLKLPRIIVDDSTGPKFMNLIAYEMCPDFENNFGVTSYIHFINSLIDQPNDVRELRKAKILHNFLGSDKEVAQLFNKMSTDLVPDPYAYGDVKVQIQKYYSSTKRMTWINRAVQEPFSSPLAFQVLLCILIALVFLSALQVWYLANLSPRPMR